MQVILNFEPILNIEDFSSIHKIYYPIKGQQLFIANLYSNLKDK